jgi:hypothetical protein
MRSLLSSLILLVACADDTSPSDAGSSADAARIDSGTGAPDAAAGEDCDPKHVSCDLPEPACSGGQVPVVLGSCWGPCIDQIMCAPVACDPTGSPPQCPAGWGCLSSGTCAPPRGGGGDAGT